MADATRETLIRYLKIPAEERLKVVEDNLIMLVKALSAEEPPAVNVILPMPAVLLDIVRELRLLKGTTAEHSPAENGKAPESPPLLRVEPIDYEGNTS